MATSGRLQLHAMQGAGGGGGLGWVGLAASCRSRPSGVGFLACPTTRLNYLTVRFQGRADYRQPPDPTEAHMGGRYRCPVCRRARGQGCGRGPGLARGGGGGGRRGGHPLNPNKEAGHETQPASGSVFAIETLGSHCWADKLIPKGMSPILQQHRTANGSADLP